MRISDWSSDVCSSDLLGLVQEIARLIGVRRRPVVMHPRFLRAYAAVEEWAAPLFGREPDVTRDAVVLLAENLYCSSQRAQDELGYQPQTLETMICDCRDWMYSAGLLAH